MSWKEQYKLIFDVLPFVLSNGADQIVYVYITLLFSQHHDSKEEGQTRSC
jgi:hypothetical protein